MKNQSALALPPGSFGLPIVGETFSFLQDSGQFALSRHNKYGPVFKTHLFGRPTLSIRGAQALRFVLTNENKYFINTLPPTTKALLGDRSLTLQMGGVHTQRRKLLYQAFQARILAEYISKMEDITEQYLQKWVACENLTWYPELRSYTFDVACHFLVGLEKASETPLRDLFEVWSAGLFSVPLALPWTRFGRALQARKQLLEFLEAIILQRQHQKDPSLDALQLLLQAHDEEGKGLEIEELKDQVLTLLFAGHETLTSALASFCLIMAQHREVLERCRAEQHSLGATELNLETLAQMGYLEQVLKEVLRFMPPVGGGFREVIQPCEFNGYHVPQGWNILYQIGQTHQDASIYSSPEQFDPERFSLERAEAKGKPMGYVPFGGGARECIGKEFARLEIKLFAARLLRDYEWELLPHQNLDIDPIPVPHPRDGLKVKLSHSV